MRSNFAPLVVFTTLSTVRFMSVKTPMLDRISHSAEIMTTKAIPTATDSRKDNFMAVHGSTRETLSLTLRGAKGRSPPGSTAPPAVWGGTGEPSARSAVPVWPTVLTRCLLRCRPQCRPRLQTLRYRRPARLQTRYPSVLKRLSQLSPLHLAPHHLRQRQAQPRCRDRRFVPPQRLNRACLAWRTAHPSCCGRSGALRQPGIGLSCPSP